jgi:hypothetical protein
MADQTNSSGSSGNTLLAVIVGALLVGIAFFFALGGIPGGEQANDENGVTIVDDNPDVNVDLPDVNITENDGSEGSGSQTN